MKANVNKKKSSGAEKRTMRIILITAVSIIVLAVAALCLWYFVFRSVNAVYKGADIPQGTASAEFDLYPSDSYSVDEYIIDGDVKTLKVSKVFNTERFIRSYLLNCTYRAVYRDGLVYTYNEQDKTNPSKSGSAPVYDGRTVFSQYHVDTETGIGMTIYFFEEDGGDYSAVLVTD